MKATALVLVGVLCLAIWWKSGHRREGAPAPNLPEDSLSATGWVVTGPPNGTDPNQVVIVAAPNCPRPAARRAAELAEQLAAQQIPCIQTGTVEFTFTTDAEVEQMNKVMNAGAPMVFVNRKVKSNPTLVEVVAEYRALAHR